MEELVFQYPLMKFGQFDLPEPIKDYRIEKKDKEILRRLASRKAEIALLSIHRQKVAHWKDLNNLKKTRPLVWINEMPWHELDHEDELKLQTSNTFTRFLETRLRRSIYTWDHFPVDSIVEPEFPCYYIIKDSGFGISEHVDIATIDNRSEIYSRGFKKQLRDEKDIEKIKIPEIRMDSNNTERMYQSMNEVIGDILKVYKKGIPGFWFSPWDELIRWLGVQDALSDLMLRPDFIHKIMEKLATAYLIQLDQYEEQGLLALNNGNYRIGSGGLGYTDQLPQKDFDPKKIKARDLWGCGAAQIFSGVSPSMHEEFALDYEIRYMSRFGLNYYGCCEPLDKKVNILRKIPNLRKISVSPWADLETAADNIGRDFVISYKPSPSLFATDNFEIDHMKKDLESSLDKLKGCVVEVIMKDISTVKYRPERLWLWAEMAMEIVNKFS